MEKLSQKPKDDHLKKVVKKHLRSTWRRPLAKHSVEAFESIRGRVEQSNARLIFDSCSGTGDSTRQLAARFSDALIIGIDKSQHRLARHRRSDDFNYVMVRADVNDFWRLAATAGWQLSAHYLFYPNPYPKASQLRKRWYASPAFSALLNLQGYLTVRTNWSLYAEEFVAALSVAGFKALNQPVSDETPISMFEAKYRERGDTLFEVGCDLGKKFAS